MSLIDKNFLKEYYQSSELTTMPAPTKNMGVGNVILHASKYVASNIFLPNNNGKVAHIQHKLHIVDNLSARILIRIDIMSPQDGALILMA